MDIIEPSTRRHNWLYSVVPSFKDSDSTDPGIYLVGYCKDDRLYFTARLKETTSVNHVLVDSLDIPTYGCQGETF